MTVNARFLKGDPTTNSFRLGITVESDTITVEAGEFVINKVVYRLDDVEQFKLTTRSHTTFIAGTIALEVSSGETRLVVDEQIDDGVDVEYDFKAGGYVPLFQAFFCELPANTSTFANVEVLTFQIVPSLEIRHASSRQNQR